MPSEQADDGAGRLGAERDDALDHSARIRHAVDVVVAQQHDLVAGPGLGQEPREQVVERRALSVDVPDRDGGHATARPKTAAGPTQPFTLPRALPMRKRPRSIAVTRWR